MHRKDRKLVFTVVFKPHVLPAERRHFYQAPTGGYFSHHSTSSGCGCAADTGNCHGVHIRRFLLHRSFNSQCLPYLLRYISCKYILFVLNCLYSSAANSAVTRLRNRVTCNVESLTNDLMPVSVFMPGVEQSIVELTLVVLESCKRYFHPLTFTLVKQP